MLIYIIKKILSFLLILLLLSLVSAVIIYYAPNAPLGEMTFLQAYNIFYQQFFSNQFAFSNYSLWECINQILLPTFELAILAIFCSIVVGFPIGIIAGLTNSDKLNHVIRFICLIFYASPIIWIAVLVMSISSADWMFIINTSYQPTIKSSSLLNILLASNDNQYQLLLNEMKHSLIPIMILTIQPCIITIQLVSQQVSVTARQNYIKVARIRENSLYKILFRHLLPNAIPNTIPQLTYNITTLLFSTMTIEILLNRSGLGTWVFSAFHHQNYTIIAFAIFSCGALVSLLTLLSEIVVVLIYPIQSRTLYE